MTPTDWLNEAFKEDAQRARREEANASKRTQESAPSHTPALLMELKRSPFRMRFAYDPGTSFSEAIHEARIWFVQTPIDFAFERPCGGPVSLDVSSSEGIQTTMSGIAALLHERGQRRCTQEELLGIAASLRSVQGSFLIASGIFRANADGGGAYDENYVMAFVIDGDTRSLMKMRWDEFVNRPGHILAVVNENVPRPSELRARSGSML